MKQVFIKGGSVTVQEVPAPAGGPKNVLVSVEHSCISIGTELASVNLSALPLHRRALKQPQHVKRVLEMAREQGVVHALERVRGKLSGGTPAGYSAAGIVLAVGAEVDGISVGQRVACAGAGYANHAEVIDVPVNLVCPVPDGVGLEAASTVALGSIAMQGVRRAAPTMGEVIVVYGLGALGQLTAQILRVNGCRTVGIDLDSGRLEVARRLGLDHALSPRDGDIVRRIVDITDGHGADGVIITAAAQNSEIISTAFKACRRKGRVVLVGDVGLELKREDFYRNEIDFLISSSYGPGRYDPHYEEGGQDYPIAYVRWTEQRNMQEYLRLLGTGGVSLRDLDVRTYAVEEAQKAYADLQNADPRPLFALLRYPEHTDRLARRVELPTPATPHGKDTIRVALVGAGSFAQGMHIPNMNKLSKSFHLHAVCGRTGPSAQVVALLQRAAYLTTDLDEVLKDPAVDLVLITTRHDLHAGMALAALQAGKHVMVEKPLALNEGELAAIEAFYRDQPNGPVLFTGFNRRFSPAVKAAKEALRGRNTPLIVNYRMNAGFIPPDHWVHGPEGGGRNIGEACHIYDLFDFLVDAPVGRVSASSLRPSGTNWRRNDNFVATVSYDDGSICTLTYTALGDRTYPKERFEVFCDRKVVAMDDYRELVVHGGAKGWKGRAADKGHLAELEALAATLIQGREWPISLESQLRTTRVSFEVERQIMERGDPI